MYKQSFFLCLIIAVLFFSSCIPGNLPDSRLTGTIDEQLRAVLKIHKVEPIQKAQSSPVKVELGRLLFWDKILSGNKNISCATCHLPQAATSDALPVSIGEGGIGAAAKRIPPADKGKDLIFVPRNSPDIFNRGDFQTMFWDGRVMVRKNGAFLAPVSGTPQIYNMESCKIGITRRTGECSCCSGYVSTNI